MREGAALRSLAKTMTSNTKRLKVMFMALVLLSQPILTTFTPLWLTRASAQENSVEPLGVEELEDTVDPEVIIGGEDNEADLYGPGDELPDNLKFDEKELTEEREIDKEVFQHEDGSKTERNYLSPKYYEDGEDLTEIDSSLIEDTDASDSGVVGRTFGKVLSFFRGKKSTFTIKDNKWKTKFAPTNDRSGMVRIKYKGDTLIFKPLDANDSDPYIHRSDDGTEFLRYDEVWPGVDIEYTVHGDRVKQNIVLKNKDSVNNVAFKVFRKTKGEKRQKAGGIIQSAEEHNGFNIKWLHG